MHPRLFIPYAVVSILVGVTCAPSTTLATIDPSVTIDIKKTIQEVYKAPSITADTTIKQKSVSPTYDFVPSKPTSYGLSDYAYKKTGNKKNDITYTLHTEKDALTDASRAAASITAQADTGERATIELEARVVSDDIYFNLKKMEVTNASSQESTIDLYGNMLEGIINQWIHIPISTAIKRSDLSLQKKGAGGLIKEDLSSDQKIELLNALIDSKAVTIKQIPDSNTDTAHIRITIIKRHIPTLINKITPILGESSLTTAEKKDLRKALMKFKPPTIDLWINTGTHLPNKLLIQGTWNSLKQSAYSNRLTGSRGSYTVETVWSNWGKNVRITAPSSSKTVEQILNQLFANNTTMNTMSVDMQRVTDIRQLQTAFELHYSDQNRYPIATQPIVLGESSTTCLNNTGFSTYGCLRPYMSSVPRDPGEHTYQYQSSDGSTYTLTATLDEDFGNLKAGTITATPVGLKN